MNKRFLLQLSAVLLIIISGGCANITTPTGGKKDIIPPKRLTISPADSLKNTRPKRIELTFNEYIVLADASKEVQISPLLSIDPVVSSLNKKVTVKIADTLLEENTTYRVSFGSAIRDLHENNPYPAYTYIFSTGSYFDSLELSGSVTNAGTGLLDTGGAIIMLYNASENDSAIVRHKPKYITRSNASGNFKFKGLPKKSYRIYAVKDANDNMMYDGETEMVAFMNNNVVPGDTAQHDIALKLFKEDDTSGTKEVDTVKAGLRRGAVAKDPSKEPFTYNVNVDTSNKEKKSFDINNKLIVNFSRLAVINKDKVTLSLDSEGTTIPQSYTIIKDTLQPHALKLDVPWRENTVYTLKLAKGYAKDTSGADANPGKFIFRTKEDEDYGKITIHLPGKYNSRLYVLQVISDKDTIYQKPVTDSIIVLNRLKPAKYSFSVIEDRNHNGKWDAGQLFKKIQPETVIPYPNGLVLKAGWDNTIDFEPIPEPKKVTGKADTKTEGKK